MSDHLSTPPESRPDARQRQQSQRPAASEEGNEAWVTIGQIVALFGIRGDVKVRPQTDIPNRFSQLREVYLGPDHQRFRITKASAYKENMLLLHLKGIESANAAQPLVTQNLSIPLAEIPALPDDQYYIHDLIGLRVESPTGQHLGIIADVLPTGANDVYLVREATSGRDVLVPAVKEMVKRVDIPAGVIIIDPLPGLFDDRFEEVC
jgi:16S rRNA processing protein RimM